MLSRTKVLEVALMFGSLILSTELKSVLEKNPRFLIMFHTKSLALTIHWKFFTVIGNASPLFTQSLYLSNSPKLQTWKPLSLPQFWGFWTLFSMLCNNLLKKLWNLLVTRHVHYLIHIASVYTSYRLRVINGLNISNFPLRPCHYPYYYGKEIAHPECKVIWLPLLPGLIIVLPHLGVLKITTS